MTSIQNDISDGSTTRIRLQRSFTILESPTTVAQQDCPAGSTPSEPKIDCYVHLETEAAGEKAAAVPAERTRAEMIFMVFTIRLIVGLLWPWVSIFLQQHAMTLKQRIGHRTTMDGRTFLRRFGRIRHSGIQFGFCYSKKSKILNDQRGQTDRLHVRTREGGLGLS